MQQNISLGSNGAYRVRSLSKSSTRLRGTNFCTSSPSFAPSFVRQPNSPECTQWFEMHQNISLASNGVDRVRSLRKIPTRLCGTNFCTRSAHFPPSFLRQPNGPECPKSYETNQNNSLGSSGVDRVRLLRKIPTRLCGTNFCTSSARFASSFVRQPNLSRVHPNSTKRTKMSV